MRGGERFGFRRAYGGRLLCVPRRRRGGPGARGATARSAAGPVSSPAPPGTRGQLRRRRRGPPPSARTAFGPAPCGAAGRDRLLVARVAGQVVAAEALDGEDRAPASRRRAPATRGAGQARRAGAQRQPRPAVVAGDGLGWKRRSAGSVYSRSQPAHSGNPAIVVFARSYGRAVTMVKRGPQCVQVMNGCRWRRSAGSDCSARQWAQMAVSAGPGCAAPPREGRMVNPANRGRPPPGRSPTRRRPAVERPIRSARRSAPTRPGTLDLGDHTLGGVGDIPRQPQLARQAVDKGPEADALDHAAHGDATSVHGGLLPGGHQWPCDGRRPGGPSPAGAAAPACTAIARSSSPPANSPIPVGAEVRITSTPG